MPSVLPPSSLSQLLTSRGSTGGRISAAGDIANGSLSLAAIIGIPVAIGIAILLIVIVCAVRTDKTEKESGEESLVSGDDRDYV
jgi:hypothetical protein